MGKIETQLDVEQQISLTFDTTKNSLQIYPEFITPAKAAQLLESNIENNRKVNRKVVDSYARQMLDGLWHSDSGETIKFDTASRLCDGQHRLRGVVRAGEMSDEQNKPFKGVEMLIASGIPKEALTSIDDGHKRTLSNAFDIAGMPVKNKQAVKGALICLLNLKGCTEIGKHYDAVSGARRNSTGELLAFYESLPRFKKISNKFFTTFRTNLIGKTMSLSTALAMYYLYHDIDEEVCYAVLATYETGIPVDGQREHSPTYKVYQKARRAKELRVRIKPWEHVQYFLWAYTKSLENSKDPMPRVLPWHWDSKNPVIDAGQKKLRRL